MVNLCILIDLPKFECQKSNHKRDTEVRNHCYVNNARVLYLFTNNVK